MAARARNESHYVDTIQGIDAIKIQTKESLFSKITQWVYTIFQQKVFDLGRLSLKFGLIIEWVSSFFLIGLLGLSGWLVLNDKISIGEMIAILQLSGMLMASIAQSALTITKIKEAKVAFDRMYEFSSLKPENSIQLEIGKNNPGDFSFGRLKVSDLSFRFPGRKAILSDINLEIRKDRIVALLGESGGGKTTLLQLLQKFYLPDSGKICLDEMNINDLTISSYRSILGVVPQEIKIFNGSLLDNITLGEIPDNLKQEDLLPGLERLNQYGFELFWNQFPNGYATLLGEDGINISGGQKQLIGWARALYNKPQFLLLDEPTASMDRNTEQFVMKSD